jgi:hypothetical protein
MISGFAPPVVVEHLVTDQLALWRHPDEVGGLRQHVAGVVVLVSQGVAREHGFSAPNPVLSPAMTPATCVP